MNRDSRYTPCITWLHALLVTDREAITWVSAVEEIQSIKERASVTLLRTCTREVAGSNTEPYRSTRLTCLCFTHVSAEDAGMESPEFFISDIPLQYVKSNEEIQTANHNYVHITRIWLLLLQMIFGSRFRAHTEGCELEVVVTFMAVFVAVRDSAYS
jgi:hypothetical protein